MTWTTYLFHKLPDLNKISISCSNQRHALDIAIYIYLFLTSNYTASIDLPLLHNSLSHKQIKKNLICHRFNLRDFLWVAVTSALPNTKMTAIAIKNIACCGQETCRKNHLDNTSACFECEHKREQKNKLPVLRGDVTCPSNCSLERIIMRYSMELCAITSIIKPHKCI